MWANPNSTGCERHSPRVIPESARPGFLGLCLYAVATHASHGSLVCSLVSARIYSHPDISFSLEPLGRFGNGFMGKDHTSLFSTSLSLPTSLSLSVHLSLPLSLQKQQEKKEKDYDSRETGPLKKKQGHTGN